MPLSEEEARSAYLELVAALHEARLAEVERTALRLDARLRRSSRLNSARFLDDDRNLPVPGWRERLFALVDAIEQMVVAPFLMRDQIVRAAPEERPISALWLEGRPPFAAGEVAAQAEVARGLQSLLWRLQEQLAEEGGDGV